MIKILIADDHQLVIDGIKSILDGEKDIEILGEAKDGEEVQVLVTRANPDLVIMDLNMPKTDGIEATIALREKYPDLKILILTMFNETGFVKKMAEAGAHGFILKNTGKEELLIAIHLLMEGKTYFGQEVTETLVNSYKKSEVQEVSLTSREKDVLRSLAEGHTTAEIAEILFISTHTVETHRKNLLSKCHQKTSAGLVKFAIEKDLL